LWGSFFNSSQKIIYYSIFAKV